MFHKHYQTCMTATYSFQTHNKMFELSVCYTCLARVCIWFKQLSFVYVLFGGKNITEKPVNFVCWWWFVWLYKICCCLAPHATVLSSFAFTLLCFYSNFFSSRFFSLFHSIFLSNKFTLRFTLAHCFVGLPTIEHTKAFRTHFLSILSCKCIHHQFLKL